LGFAMMFRRGVDRNRVGVYFRHDQRHIGVVAPGRGVVDDDAALRADLGRPFLADCPAGRHQAEIGIRKIIGFEVLDLEGLVAEGHFGPYRAARGKGYDFADWEGALRKNIEHFAADIARRPGDCDFETHGSRAPLSPC
jgi:hypothetical protein